MVQPMTPEQEKAWMAACKRAGPALEAIRRQELRSQDNVAALEILTFDADYTVPPRLARASSGMVEMQRILAKAGRRA